MKNKFGSNVLTLDKQLLLRNKISQLQTKQTYYKNRNIKHLNTTGRYTKEFLDNHGWNDVEFTILDFYEKVYIVNGKVKQVSYIAKIKTKNCDIKYIPQKYISIIK